VAALLAILISSVKLVQGMETRSYLVNERQVIFLAAKKSLAFFSASCNIDAIAQIAHRRRLYELIYITRGVIYRAVYELARNLKFRKLFVVGCRMEKKEDHAIEDMDMQLFVCCI